MLVFPNLFVNSQKWNFCYTSQCFCDLVFTHHLDHIKMSCVYSSIDQVPRRSQQEFTWRNSQSWTQTAPPHTRQPLAGSPGLTARQTAVRSLTTSSSTRLNMTKILKHTDQVGRWKSNVFSYQLFQDEKISSYVV